MIFETFYQNDEISAKKGPTGAVVRALPSSNAVLTGTDRQGDRQTDRLTDGQDHILSQADALTIKNICLTAKTST